MDARSKYAIFELNFLMSESTILSINFNNLILVWMNERWVAPGALKPLLKKLDVSVI